MRLIVHSLEPRKYGPDSVSLPSSPQQKRPTPGRHSPGERGAVAVAPGRPLQPRGRALRAELRLGQRRGRRRSARRSPRPALIYGSPTTPLAGGPGGLARSAPRKPLTRGDLSWPFSAD